MMQTLWSLIHTIALHGVAVHVFVYPFPLLNNERISNISSLDEHMKQKQTQLKELNLEGKNIEEMIRNDHLSNVSMGENNNQSLTRLKRETGLKEVREVQKQNAETPDTGGLIPGLPQIPVPSGIMPSVGSFPQGLIPGANMLQALNGSPTLYIGGFSVLVMPMPGMSEMLPGLMQNVLPMLQQPQLPSVIPNPLTG